MGIAKVVRLLLEQGAKVDARANDGTTPLYLALQQGRIEVARILVASGADVNAKTNVGDERGRDDLDQGSVGGDKGGCTAYVWEYGSVVDVHMCGLWSGGISSAPSLHPPGGGGAVSFNPATMILAFLDAQ